MPNQKMFKLVGRRGAYASTYPPNKVALLYADGVSCANLGDILQVWSAMANGDLLGYDAARTRRLTDKILASRSAT